jgi:hypothetical protein
MGLLISTSGFGRNLIQGRLEVERHLVRLGSANKVVELCQFYVRKGLGIWEPGLVLPRLLFDETH